MHPTAAKLQERLRERGLDVEVRELPASTRTAAEAAAAIGCEVGQIVKSLVFRRGEEPVMVLCAGDRRVDAARLGLRAASPDEAREATGFAIGGVPPLGPSGSSRRSSTSRSAASRRSGPQRARRTRSSRRGRKHCSKRCPARSSPRSTE
jgi:hypothetical protein